MRRPLPVAIRDAPELTLGLEFVYEAYWELSTCRSVGFGSGPIPWSSVNDYAQAHRLTRDEASEFVWLIRQMDYAHLLHMEEQREKDKPKT